MAFNSEFSLYSQSGQRKYLNCKERVRFYHFASELKEDRRLFCLLMFYTGARLTEIHSLRVGQLDFENKAVILRTLKKKTKTHYRSIPIPDTLVESLTRYYEALRIKRDKAQIWAFSNRTARRIIKTVMIKADIKGAQACGRGLRHGYAVACVENNIPLTQLQKWLGHSDIATTSIYLDVSGKEEREWASRLWR